MPRVEARPLFIMIAREGRGLFLAVADRVLSFLLREITYHSAALGRGGGGVSFSLVLEKRHKLGSPVRRSRRAFPFVQVDFRFL